MPRIWSGFAFSYAVAAIDSDLSSRESSHFLLWPDFRNALRRMRGPNGFSSIFQMQPPFPENGMRWPFRFAKDGILKCRNCFPGCEISDEPPSHQSIQCSDEWRLFHSIRRKHRRTPPIFSSGWPRRSSKRGQ